MKTIVTYTLAPDGTVPAGIDDGGYFPKPIAGNPPQDLLLVGLIAEGAAVPDGMTEIASEAALETHLGGYTSGWTGPDGGPFDAAAAAAAIKGKRG